ncbi:related to LAS21 transferase, adding a side chain to the GPI core structure [Cephalotrichum gorgonifer]|uniref:GPI ethanolamine phosphate transferase 2 n=1 Tax=Cephalotrichum gorgonifer TaxID=2041049 RepID=A0AAE8SRS4_9PEZI|nr:related to LAS21 transferase, adding a side chain to the GPI core structure [Cephalotrichum gorgonifer]
MARSLLVSLIVAANLLIPVAILIFAGGFFPYKPFIPGLAEYEPLDPEFGEVPEAPFDRLIFMVVDALRSDFVYSENSGFQFTQELIRDGAAIPFTAFARSPTVTMPRLKSITTGSIPSFLDAILNIDEGETTSSLAAQDTWLAQIKAKDNGKLLMYGDDTWLKLFPDIFDRHDGTSSFFVADFTEVDHNVTRNIAGELENQDWNTMILHYLGLDHIGHKSGPRSSNMVPKQREMDGIVKQLYHAMETKEHLSSTLLVMCGDHGMNDAGNHGASSAGETSAALTFMSPKLRALSSRLQSPLPYREDFQYYSRVEQSDLAPSLAGLLGFPVPQNNLGAFIPEFLPLWDRKSDQVQLLIRNARQILGVARAAFGEGLFDLNADVDPCSDAKDDAHRLACDWRLINKRLSSFSSYEEAPPEWVDQLTEWLRSAQDLMSGMASNYDTGRLILGQAVAAVACILATAALFFAGTSHVQSLLIFAAVTIAYGVMMFASSYVEEEQHFWYWTTTAWMALLVVKYRTTLRGTIIWFVLVLGATRIIRGWNQTGQKFAGSPDIVKTFIVTNPRLLWALVVATYAWLQGNLRRPFGWMPRTVTTWLGGVLISAAFTFKLNFTNEDSPELVVRPMSTLQESIPKLPLVSHARLVFASALVIAGYAAFLGIRGGHRSKEAFEMLHHLYTVIALTQSRVTNIPLFLLHALQVRFLSSVDLSVPDLTISSLLLQHMSYFAFGGSNAISSVDLSSAYNGVSDFNVLAVGVLTFISNWAGPVYFSSATTLLLLRARRKRAEGGSDTPVYAQHVAMLTAFVTWSVLFVMVACTVLRTHLFIWTVFSPKYLYWTRATG